MSRASFFELYLTRVVLSPSIFFASAITGTVYGAYNGTSKFKKLEKREPFRRFSSEQLQSVKTQCIRKKMVKGLVYGMLMPFGWPIIVPYHVIKQIALKM
jgi:hypothetical protein